MRYEHQQTPVGSTVRVCREDLGWSVNELARQSGLDVAVVHRIESGEIARPTARTLTKLAMAMQMPLADVFAAAGYVVPEQLPSFRPYLRARYSQLPESAVEELDRVFEDLERRYGPSHGPADGEDETPD